MHFASLCQVKTVYNLKISQSISSSSKTWRPSQQNVTIWYRCWCPCWPFDYVSIQIQTSPCGLRVKMISEIPGSQLSKHMSTAEASVQKYLMWNCRLGADHWTGLCECRCTTRAVYFGGSGALEITRNLNRTIWEKSMSDTCCSSRTHSTEKPIYCVIGINITECCKMQDLNRFCNPLNFWPKRLCALSWCSYNFFFYSSIYIFITMTITVFALLSKKC